MKFKTLLSLMLSVTVFSTSSFALEIDKPIPADVLLKPQTENHAAISKPIYLMNLKLTPVQRQQFTTFESLNPKLAQSLSGLPPKADVGMNNTPVLDQGQHASCVTFANTAAVDALLGKGDYVSQLCSLAVGNYMESHGYYPSGWDGSFGGIVINQLLQLGVINTSTQKSKTCGGLSEYPVNSPNIGNPMPLDDYNSLSQNLNKNIYYRPIMTISDRLAWGMHTDKQSAAILQQVKKALVNKPGPTDPNSAGRLTFATMLPVDYCSVGACGSYHAHFDTWALTDAIKKDPSLKVGFHEMVITGYDDNAIVYDNEGKMHQGLLTLRNSWGSDAGDNGNYYMTYEFFRQYVSEVQEIIWLSMD